MKNSEDLKEDGQNINKSEDKILSECHLYIWNNFPELRYCSWHVANERKTTKLQGAILKAKGLVPGVPDYVLNFKGKTYYFEMKSSIGVFSDNQKKCHAAMKLQGFEVIIIRNFDEFEKYLTNLLTKFNIN